MPILEILLVLIVIGLVLWLVNQYIPMQPPIKTILNVVVMLLVILWLISAIFPGLGTVRIGR